MSPKKVHPGQKTILLGQKAIIPEKKATIPKKGDIRHRLISLGKGLAVVAFTILNLCNGTKTSDTWLLPPVGWCVIDGTVRPPTEVDI